MTRGFWVRLIVTVASIGLAGDLFAFSVGKIDVQSAANEPFRAEVPFVLEPHERDREFEVLLGSQQDYRHEELERPPILEHMHIILSPDKQDTVRIFSNVPITEETFDLLILLRSGKLTIVRNYHVELPEPGAAAAQQVAVVEPAIRLAATDPASSPQSAAPAPPPASTPESVNPSPSLPVEARLDLPDLYGPIRRGETMYIIVGKLNVPRDQRWQAVVSLWRLNHGAFLRGNLHGLLVGAHLEIPEDFATRLNVMKREAAQRIIANQWQAWQRRQVTTTAQALAMTTELAAEEPEPYEETVDAPAQQPDVMPQVAETVPPPAEPVPDDGSTAAAPPDLPAATEVAEAVPSPEEPIPDDSIPAAAPQDAEATPPLAEPAADDSAAAIAPPQVVRLPTDEGSSFVSTQELKLLLGNLEDRLLRRLAPVQESQGTAAFVSPTELQISLQDLENRLTRRVAQMMEREGSSLPSGPPAQPNPVPMPPGSDFEFAAGVAMPPVTYLLVLINLVLLVFGLTLGWRWWRQNTRGEV